jgi:hypothetical protein
VNNVERAELRELAAGDSISFTVRGTDIVHHLLTAPDSQLPQRWSLAVVGHFIGVLITPLNPSYTVPQRLQVGERCVLLLPRRGPAFQPGEPGSLLSSKLESLTVRRSPPRWGCQPPQP